MNNRVLSMDNSEGEAIEDPLDELLRRVESAASTTEARVLSPNTKSPDRPLALLETWIDKARELHPSPIQSRSGPLGRLFKKMQEARKLTSPNSRYPRTDNPLEDLQNAADTEKEKLGTIPVPELKRSRRTDSGSRALEAKLGREVFKILKEKPLSPKKRTAAVKELLAALENPNRAKLRDILETLL